MKHAQMALKTQTLRQELATHQQICLIPRNRCQKREAFLGCEQKPAAFHVGDSRRFTMSWRVMEVDSLQKDYILPSYMGIVTKHMK